MYIGTLEFPFIFDQSILFCHVFVSCFTESYIRHCGKPEQQETNETHHTYFFVHYTSQHIPYLVVVLESARDQLQVLLRAWQELHRRTPELTDVIL